MLHLASLTYAYGPARPVLDIAAFDVPAGRHALLLGPSGSGKSTLPHAHFAIKSMTWRTQ